MKAIGNGTWERPAGTPDVRIRIERSASSREHRALVALRTQTKFESNPKASECVACLPAQEWRAGGQVAAGEPVRRHDMSGLGAFRRPTMNG